MYPSINLVHEHRVRSRHVVPPASCTMLFIVSLFQLASLALSQFEGPSGIPACAIGCSNTTFEGIGCVASASPVTQVIPGNFGSDT